MAKRKKKPIQTHRVYCTYFPDGRYYIGYSCKTDKQFEKYFGSSTKIKAVLAEATADCKPHEGEALLTKEVIIEYPTRAPAKMQEFSITMATTTRREMYQRYVTCKNKS